MTVAAPAEGAQEGRRFHVKRVLVGALVVVVIGAAANLLGWDIKGWFSDLWDTITKISAQSLIAAIALKTLQTTATAFAWFSILKFAYPGRVRWLEILACYAASVALNGILPANLGTLVMLLMFTTIIAGATFAAILGGYAVQKIFFTLSGTFVYLYLFLSVEGSFDIKFEFVHTHPWATAICFGGGGFILYLLIRRLWQRVLVWWEDAKEGGGILGQPRAYFLRVFLPSFIGWVASLGVMAVFLAAYSIPVTFDTLMRISGGNSIANVTSVTPGGAGVTQAFNVASLNGLASATDATAYSGWTRGKSLVGDSYEQAKQKAAEQKAAHEARKQAKKEAEAATS